MQKGPSTSQPSLSVADACFEAMVRHNRQQTTCSGSLDQASANAACDKMASSKVDIDLAWGAAEVAIAIFGPPSTDNEVNERRRRRVYVMHDSYLKAVADAKLHKRPPPVNIGWLALPDTNAIALHKPTYGAFVLAQLGGQQ